QAGAMMLRQVEALEPGLVRELDELEPIAEEALRRGGRNCPRVVEDGDPRLHGAHLTGRMPAHRAGPEDAYACPITSQPSTLTKVAGASGISRRRLKVASAARACSSVSKSQNECWMSSPSRLRAQ